MAESAKITTIGEQSAPVQAETEQENGKKQLPGESTLWFHRYLIYRDLGHKRTLRAAVAKERETLRVVKEATKSPQEKKAGGVAVCRDVPGSWKNACKVYRWSERAKAFDAWLLNSMANITYEHLADTYANKFKRVQLIEALITSLNKALNGAVEKGGLEHDTYLRCIKQIAALVRQMEDEMRGFSEEEMRSAIVAHGRTFMGDIEKAYHSGQRVITRT
jgi:hypothetical protein